MTITLSPDLEAQVRKDAAANGYDDVENYIQAALWSSPNFTGWELDDITIANLKESCQQAERGEFLDADEVKRRMKAMKTEWMKSRSAA